MKTRSPDRPFASIRMNPRQPKPRTRGMTEIRGPYYTPVGYHYLSDLLETMGDSVDSLKFSGGSFTLMPPTELKRVIKLAHNHAVSVSTGGFIEYVLTHGAGAVDRYLRDCKRVGFDTIELSAGFITLPADDWLRLVEKVQKVGLQPKPEVGIQFGAGGASSTEALAAEGTRDVEWVIALAKRFLSAGAAMIMIESEGITENVETWRTDVVARLVSALGLEKLMFEAADPPVFQWYVKHYGPEVNLFVDHSQIIQLEALRRGIWGTTDLWGRVISYQP